MDDSRISLEFGDPVDIDQDLAYEVPDLHSNLVDNSPFEIDLRFEFEAPQYYDFFEELKENADLKRFAEDPSNAEWFTEHHIHHESQKSSAEVVAPAVHRYRAVPEPEESSASIEKLLAEHNRKIREENMLKVKRRRADIGSSCNSPTKRPLVSRNDTSVRKQSPPRLNPPPQPKLVRKSLIVASLSLQSPQRQKRLRKSVIVSSSASELPPRSKLLRKSTIVASGSSESVRRPTSLRKSTIVAATTPRSPPRLPMSLRKSVIIPESERKESKLKIRDLNIAASVPDHGLPKAPVNSALLNKRTRVDLNVCAPALKIDTGVKDNGIPVPKRPRSGKENIDDIAEMLAVHNKKFKSRASYVPRQHSARDVRQWEKLTGKLWYELGPEEREVANQEIAKMLTEAASSIKPAENSSYLRCPR